MKNTYPKVTEMVARFVRWAVVGVLFFILAMPIIASISSSA